jgi:hypothetical protein
MKRPGLKGHYMFCEIGASIGPETLARCPLLAEAVEELGCEPDFDVRYW